jgi:hypothetical protein
MCFAGSPADIAAVIINVHHGFWKYKGDFQIVTSNCFIAVASFTALYSPGGDCDARKGVTSRNPLA